LNQIEQGELLGVIQGLGFKKGQTVFTKWRRKKLERIREIEDKINEDKLNIFERLIRHSIPKTVFDNLIKKNKRK